MINTKNKFGCSNQVSSLTNSSRKVNDKSTNSEQVDVLDVKKTHSENGDKALFNHFLYAQSPLPCTDNGSDTKATEMQYNNARNKENAFATIRQWTADLWLKQSTSSILLVNQYSDVPISITSSQINGALSISVSCANPIFFERMKTHRAELERKAELADVQLVLVNTSLSVTTQPNDKNRDRYVI